MTCKGLWFAAFIISLACTSCATIDDTAEEDRTLTFDCNDIVVIGRLNNNRDYEHVEIDGDILGHGWMTGAISVHRPVAGPAVEKKVPVRYFGHTYLREDRTFMFVLSPTDDGIYHLSDQRLMSDQPRPTSECN
jgi:hypothetical protein